MKNEESLRVLIVEESKNDAESLANALRNAGHSIDFNHGSETSELESAVQEQHPDIVLCGSGESLPSPDNVQTLLGKHGLTPPIIVISEEASEDKVVAAKKTGFATLISYDEPDHLHLSFEKEAAYIRLQQKLEASGGTLRDSENRCHALIENSSDAVAYIHEGMHVYANQPYMDLFSIETSEDVEGTPILDMISNDQRDTFREFLKSYLDNKTTENTLEINCINPAGEPFHSSMELAPATMGGEPCTQIIIRVSSSNAALEKKIKTLTQQDMITGLANRQYFLQVLKERMANPETDGGHRALLYITLDNFKAIRDETGIEASDQALRDIAQILKSNCGEQDCLSRFGDCSFAILHYDNDQEKTQGLGETLLHGIAGNLSEVNGRAVTMTGSIGIVTINNQGTDAQSMIAYADMACDVARTAGGNQIHTHSHIVDEQSGSEQEEKWDELIRATIDEERFHLAYQPIVSLKGDTQQRYEVLLRIVDSAGQVILPGQFFSIAEKIGLSHELDRWIINAAFRQLAKLRSENKDISFYIKLTGGTLSDAGLAEWISEKLVEHCLSSDSVVFEISEQTAINDLTSSIRFTNEIRKLPCRVALEHFGQSDQPQLLKHLPVDILKIHSELISGLGSNKDHQSRVKEITGMARESGLQCIAECVDDAGSLAHLWQVGIDFIQGNFVQEPCKTINYDFEEETA
ncbi:MAG: EAL domain-containing protein [Gammaproteobacteria bacterium]|nr:EAL domain-containing protein [Gammaproteobacteria bacterium]